MSTINRADKKDRKWAIFGRKKENEEKDASTTLNEALNKLSVELDGETSLTKDSNIKKTTGERIIPLIDYTNGPSAVLQYASAKDTDNLQTFFETRVKSIRDHINTSLDNYNNTALHFAVSMNDTALIALLLLKGADPNAKNNSGVRPVSIAKRLGLKEALSLLQKHGGELPNEDDELSRQFIQSINPKAAAKKTQINRKRRVKLNNNNQQYALFAPELILEHTNVSRTIHRLRESSFSKKELTLLQAAYLGLITPEHMTSIPSSALNICDENRHNALMKAAYKGQYENVELLVNSGINLEHTDKYRQCALVWACLGSNVKVIEFLLEKGMNPNGLISENGTNDGIYGITPLIAAVYTRNHEIIDALLSAGADINKGIGFETDTKYKNPLLFACWLKYGDIVAHLLIKNAVVLSDYPFKIRRGLLLAKYIIARRNSLEEPHALSAISIYPNAVKPLTLSFAEEMTLEKKMVMFTTEESEILNNLENMINKGKDTAELYLKKVGFTISGTEELKIIKDNAKAKNIYEAQIRQNYREELNFDKQLDQHLDVIMDLTEQIPDEGTVLDTHWVATVQCVLELVAATSRNSKTQYVKHSAQIVHHSSELIRAIESAFSINDARDKPAGKESNDHKVKEKEKVGLGLLVFDESPVRVLISAIIKKISTELPQQLILTTRISVGVWPPPSAKNDMIQAAADLAKACKVVADVCNAVGYFGLCAKNLKFNFSSGDLPFISNPDTRLSPEEYRRVNDLKLLERISNNAMKTTSPPIDDGSKFNERLDTLVKQFVAAMLDAKNSTTNHIKEEYVPLSGQVSQKCELILEEFKANNVMSLIPTDVTFEEVDTPFLLTKEFEPIGIKLLPTSTSIVFNKAKDQVRDATSHLMRKAQLAAEMASDQIAAAEMIQALLLCGGAIKRLATISKVTYVKVKNFKDNDPRYSDKLSKDIAASKDIRKLFNIWENNLNNKEIDESLYDNDNASLLEEEEGLDFENANGERILKGGRLPKLVEYLTSPLVKDTDFISAFLSSHHSFTTSTDLLDLLSKRYNLIAPWGLSKEQEEKFHKKSFAIRKKIQLIMHTWLTNLFDEDFRSNESFIFKFKDFIVTEIRGDTEKNSNNLYHLLEESIKTDPYVSKKITFEEPPKSGIPPPKPNIPNSMPINTVYSHLSSFGTFSFLDIDAQEFARQLSIFDFAYFKRVSLNDCVDEIWGDRRRKEIKNANFAPIIYAGTSLGDIIKRTNILSFWMATNILKADSIKVRVKVLAYFVQVAIYSRELNNYNAVTTVNAALVMSPISRLKKTWDLFKEKYSRLYELYEETVATVSPRGQYAAYRKVLKDLAPPAVPFLGVTLTDLTFTELGNPDYLPDTNAHINFDKRRKAYQVVQTTLMKFNVIPYNLAPVHGILEFISNIGVADAVQKSKDDYFAANPEKKKAGMVFSSPLEVNMDADTLYDDSLIAEPREEEDSDEEEAD